MVERAAQMAPVLESAVHSLRGAPHITDIRNIGMAAGFTLEARPGEPLRRPFEVAMRCWEKGFYIRFAGDCLAIAPPFTIESQEIDSLVNAIGEALEEVD